MRLPLVFLAFQLIPASTSTYASLSSLKTLAQYLRAQRAQQTHNQIQDSAQSYQGMQPQQLTPPPMQGNGMNVLQQRSSQIQVRNPVSPAATTPIPPQTVYRSPFRESLDQQNQVLQTATLFFPWMNQQPSNTSQKPSTAPQNPITAPQNPNATASQPQSGPVSTTVQSVPAPFTAKSNPVNTTVQPVSVPVSTTVVQPAPAPVKQSNMQAKELEAIDMITNWIMQQTIKPTQQLIPEPVKSAPPTRVQDAPKPTATSAPLPSLTLGAHDFLRAPSMVNLGEGEKTPEPSPEPASEMIIEQEIVTENKESETIITEQELVSEKVEQRETIILDSSSSSVEQPMEGVQTSSPSVSSSSPLTSSTGDQESSSTILIESSSGSGMSSGSSPRSSPRPAVDEEVAFYPYALPRGLDVDGEWKDLYPIPGLDLTNRFLIPHHPYTAIPITLDANSPALLEDSAYLFSGDKFVMPPDHLFRSRKEMLAKKRRRAAAERFEDEGSYDDFEDTKRQKIGHGAAKKNKRESTKKDKRESKKDKRELSKKERRSSRLSQKEEKPVEPNKSASDRVLRSRK